MLYVDIKNNIIYIAWIDNDTAPLSELWYPGSYLGLPSAFS